MNPLHMDQDQEATEEADAPPGQRNHPQGRSRNHNHQGKRYRRCEAPPGNGGGRARRRHPEEPGAELHHGAPAPQHQPAQPIPRPGVTRYRRQGDSEARVRAQQQRHRQRQQREAERAQQIAQQQDKRHHREMNQEDERERDDSALARSASTESGFHAHTDRAEGDDGLLVMSLEPEAQPDVEDEAGSYGVQLRPEAEGYTENAEAEQHPHPNYPPQPPPPPPPPPQQPREALPDPLNPEDTRNAAYSNYVYAQPPSHGGPLGLLDAEPTEEAYSEPYDIYSLSEHVYEEIGEVTTASEETESLQQRRAGFQLLEGRMGEADYQQQESVGSRLRHYDERSDGESDSPEKEAEFAPYPRADSCDQEEDVGSSAAEGKDGHFSGEETTQAENQLKQGGGTPEGEQPQAGSDKNQPADDRGDVAGEQRAENSAEESVALRHNQQKRDAISLAIKDIKEAIEEVKNRTVRSPYTPDEPKEPIWVMRQDLSPTVECDLPPQGGDVSTAARKQPLSTQTST